MATIVFFVDMEEGHLFPTFGLSKTLEDRGHVVHYIGTLDIKKSVLDQGFEFHPILEKQFPLGFRENFKKKHLNKENYSKFTFIDSIENDLPDLFNRIKPDGIIMSIYLSLEALFLNYRYGIKPIIFSPVINSNPLHECRYEFGSLKEKGYKIFQQYKNYNPALTRTSIFRKLFRRKNVISAEDFQTFISPITKFEQIIACPEQFEIPSQAQKRVHYINPCIRRNVDPPQSFINELKHKGKKIIYTSLGSQTERIHDVCNNFYTKVIDMMSDPEMADYHMVMTSKSAAELHSTMSIPKNMTILEWANSLEVLEYSSAVITHGGLGLVKESIFHGVPMIVLPDKYDQPLNAERIEYHYLGIQDNLINVTKEQLKSHLKKITTDQNIKEKVQQMKAVFRQKEEQQDGAVLIEKIFNLN